ncbi:MAG: amidophosphoribosyltransferase [Neomegalonema sp.]|nr:amidophosphoribosyltransferase [Neomegalonema sp.]
MLGAHPFDPAPGDLDADRFREECGVFGVFDAAEAANFVALGLHALQHRGQEGAGIVSLDREASEFHNRRALGSVRDNFTDKSVMARLPGDCAIGHTRYSTAGVKGQTEPRDVQPLYADLREGGIAVAHNGNFVNAKSLRAELVGRGAIFQSSSDTENILHLMANSNQRRMEERLKDALRRLEGAFSIVALTGDQMIGVRDPFGFRPLLLGRIGQGWVLASETAALDIIAAQFEREVEPGEMVVISKDGVRSSRPFERQPSRFCVFEYVYFARADSEVAGESVYSVRQRIGEELAREAPIEADVICPVPEGGTPAALGYARAAEIPFEFGITRSPYVGRTFIEPTEKIRKLGARLKLNVNKSIVSGKRVVLVDDSIVRGTTLEAIRDMIRDAGAKEVHVRIASPPTRWPCFYGVDTPSRKKLLAAQMTPEEMAKALEVDSLAFVSLDGLYRACGVEAGRDQSTPAFCDACFSGEYPIEPLDDINDGRLDLK